MPSNNPKSETSHGEIGFYGAFVITAALFIGGCFAYSFLNQHKIYIAPYLIVANSIITLTLPLWCFLLLTFERFHKNKEQENL